MKTQLWMISMGLFLISCGNTELEKPLKNTQKKEQEFLRGLSIDPASTLDVVPNKVVAEFDGCDDRKVNIQIKGTVQGMNPLLQFSINFVPNLNQIYALSQQEGTGGRFRYHGTQDRWIEVYSMEMTEAPSFDAIQSAQIIFKSFPQNRTRGTLMAAFRVNYENGKLLQGTINTPMVTGSNDCPVKALKPIIYLYPKKTTDVVVKLNYQGTLPFTYPDYDEKLRGWRVKAHPDGRLINAADKEEYSYLFWEGIPHRPMEIDRSKGFVVAGKDIKKFLRKSLSKMGLTPREYNEFIVYWYPKLAVNPYNFIHFAGKEYTNQAPLDIHPKPDSMLRVYMTYHRVESASELKITPQTLKPFKRKGFMVVEWGGGEISPEPFSKHLSSNR